MWRRKNISNRIAKQIRERTEDQRSWQLYIKTVIFSRACYSQSSRWNRQLRSHELGIWEKLCRDGGSNRQRLSFSGDNRDLSECGMWICWMSFKVSIVLISIEVNFSSRASFGFQEWNENPAALFSMRNLMSWNNFRPVCYHHEEEEEDLLVVFGVIVLQNWLDHAKTGPSLIVPDLAKQILSLLRLSAYLSRYLTIFLIFSLMKLTVVPFLGFSGDSSLQIVYTPPVTGNSVS